VQAAQVDDALDGRVLVTLPPAPLAADQEQTLVAGVGATDY